MIAVALALAASLSWGVADFLAGLKSRALTVLAVLVVSQPAGLALVALLVAVRNAPAPDVRHALYALIGGVLGVLALAAYYQGLAIGTMSVVAPVSATAAVIPLTVGVATGERPSALQAAGVALALVGVVLASREAEVEARRRTRVAAGFSFALLAALGFGFFFVAINAASAGGDVLWVTLLLRSSSFAVVLAVALAARPRLPRRPPTLGLLLLVGVLDMSANALFAAAAARGLLSIVPVLASLYPVVVVLLARAVLRERIARSQQAGVALALVGVALISAG